MSEIHDPPFYGLRLGRPRKGLEGSQVNYRSALNLPLPLAHLVMGDLKDEELGRVISGYLGPATMADYARAGIYLFHLLLHSPTRSRVLAMLALPPDQLRDADVLAHLDFAWKRQYDEGRSDMEMRHTGLAEDPDYAPLADPTPWESKTRIAPPLPPLPEEDEDDA